MKRWLRRRLVLAAPTCTLWIWLPYLDDDFYVGWRFRLNPRWRIGLAEFYRAGGHFRYEV